MRVLLALIVVAFLIGCDQERDTAQSDPPDYNFFLNECRTASQSEEEAQECALEKQRANQPV